MRRSRFLSQTEVDHYDRDGYVLLQGAFSQPEVNAMIAATRGEYKGTGQTVAQTRARARQSEGSTVDLIIFVIVLGIIGLSWLRAARRGTVYTSSGSRGSGGVWWIGGGGGGGGYSGGGGGGGGGGFSGGGGDSGGGGASGSW